MRIHEAPMYVRPVPAVRFGLAGVVAVVLCAMLLGAWERYFRGVGARPATVNSDALWALQRERINQGEGDATVLIGSSRVLFDVQPAVWERLDGRRPIQLALEGTSAVPALENLAADTAFTGRLMVGVTPPIFFSGFAYRGKAIADAATLTITARTGQWLSMHLLEPVWAFLDPDFALFTLLERQDWPERPGVHVNIVVRKLSETQPDRTTRMWDRVVTDTVYRNLARAIWAQNFGPPPGVTPAMQAKGESAQLARAVAAVEKLKARGVHVLFVRLPINGGYVEAEQRGFPRARTWDVLLARTGVQGVHFEDHPELQGYEIPEWSHLTGPEADRLTAALHGVIARVDPGFVRRGAAER